METTRRRVLEMGAATIFLSLVHGELRAADSSGRILPEGDAYAPWKLWDDPAIRGTPFALVAAATLAANPHDTQAWLFAVNADSIEVHADTSRHLGAMDAALREMHLGLGCAIENMLTIAGAQGYAATLEAVPGSLAALAERQRPVRAATLRLRKVPPSTHPRQAAISLRRTNRYAYERDRSPPPEWREFALGAGAEEGVKIFLFDSGANRQIFYPMSSRRRRRSSPTRR